MGWPGEPARRVQPARCRRRPADVPGPGPQRFERSSGTLPPLPRCRSEYPSRCRICEPERPNPPGQRPAAVRPTLSPSPPQLAAGPGLLVPRLSWAWRPPRRPASDSESSRPGAGTRTLGRHINLSRCDRGTKASAASAVEKFSRSLASCAAPPSESVVPKLRPGTCL